MEDKIVKSIRCYFDKNSRNITSIKTKELIDVDFFIIVKDNLIKDYYIDYVIYKNNKFIVDNFNFSYRFDNVFKNNLYLKMLNILKENNNDFS